MCSKIMPLCLPWLRDLGHISMTQSQRKKALMVLNLMKLQSTLCMTRCVQKSCMPLWLRWLRDLGQSQRQRKTESIDGSKTDETTEYTF